MSTVWAASDVCDIMLFQHTAGSFAPATPGPAWVRALSLTRAREVTEPLA